MNLKNLLGAVGGASSLVSTGASLVALLGVVYLVDCRITANTSEKVQACYSQAIVMLTGGVVGRAGYVAGYNTLNPALHSQEEKRKAGLFGRGGKA